jgi:four helix bundle protein
MTKDELCVRTKDLALRILKMVDALPRSTAARTMGQQIVRSSCSVAANYRAALRGKSRADFINKIAIVLEEADETLFWLEMIRDAELLPANRLQELIAEAECNTRIFAATLKTTRKTKP